MNAITVNTVNTDATFTAVNVLSAYVYVEAIDGPGAGPGLVVLTTDGQHFAYSRETGWTTYVPVGDGDVPVYDPPAGGLIALVAAFD